MKGHIYFGRMSNGAIKIGFSTDIDKRLAGLWHAVPGGISLIATMLGTPEAETWAHRKFAHLRISGEWFRPENDLLEFIEEVKRIGNEVLPDHMRADEIELAPKLPTDEQVKEEARFYVEQIAKPVKADDRIHEILDRASKRTGLPVRRIRAIWHREVRSLSAAEFLILKEIFEARSVLGSFEASRLCEEVQRPLGGLRGMGREG